MDNAWDYQPVEMIDNIATCFIFKPDARAVVHFYHRVQYVHLGHCILQYSQHL